jgi:hypothetical protein
MFVAAQSTRIADDIVWAVSFGTFLLASAGRVLVLQMTPMEETFNDAIEVAQRLERSDQSVYWGGYLTGLMRAFFGRQAVNNNQHGVLSDPSKVGDAALGYRDGFRKLADCPGWIDVDGVARTEPGNPFGVHSRPTVREQVLEA